MLELFWVRIKIEQKVESLLHCVDQLHVHEQGRSEPRDLNINILSFNAEFAPIENNSLE